MKVSTFQLLAGVWDIEATDFAVASVATSCVGFGYVIHRNTLMQPVTAEAGNLPILTAAPGVIESVCNVSALGSSIQAEAHTRRFLRGLCGFPRLKERQG